MIKKEYPAQGESVFEDVLPNGLRLAVVKKTGFRQSHAVFAARYGGADRRFRLDGEWADTPAGVAHFLEHKMFDMPDGRNVLGELSARGANPNAFTGQDMTAYHFTCTEGFETNLETLLTYVSTPWYTAESVAKEQGIIGQEILMYENYPAARGFYDAMAALFAAHPLRESVAGTVESIAAITPEILYGCHRAFYTPSNMALVCVGDVDPKTVRDMAERILPPESGAVPERDYGPEESLFPHETRHERTMAVGTPIFFLCAKVPAPAAGRGRLRARLLGELALECLTGESSAFYNDLYARGLLSRSFGAEVDDAAGAMMAILSGESRDPSAAADMLQERLALTARRGLDRAAFDRCRRARYGAELFALDQFALCARNRLSGLFGGWDAMDVFPLLEELEAEEAAAWLCENLSADRLAMSVVRPAE